MKGLFPSNWFDTTAIGGGGGDVSAGRVEQVRVEDVEMRGPKMTS